MIKINQLCKSYQDKVILSDINLSIKENTVTTFFGPNGCGKSTLMRLVAGLDKPNKGSITKIDNNHIPIVFQNYRQSLLPWYDAKKNITFPLILNGLTNDEIEKKLYELLDVFPISFSLNDKVYNLSGGQAQLVCILRALIIKPKILIFDEPFSAIDYMSSLELRDKVISIAKKMDTTILFISHDLDEAVYISDKIVFMKRDPGIIVSELDTNFPADRSADFIGSVQFAEKKLQALQLFRETIK